jgi:hypothetical protein
LFDSSLGILDVEDIQNLLDNKVIPWSSYPHNIFLLGFIFLRNSYHHLTLYIVPISFYLFVSSFPLKIL